jgi:hypothetical protein
MVSLSVELAIYPRDAKQKFSAQFQGFLKVSRSLPAF